MIPCSRSIAAAPAVGTIAATTATIACVPGQHVALPTPTTSGGLPLLTALAQRQSARELSPDPLPLALLSDLLWAANGVNRPETGKRTAATARNWQNLEVYAVTAAGVFRYDAEAHELVAVAAGDHRAATGKQPFVAGAPLNLVYVSDVAKMAGVENEGDGFRYDGVHAGIVAQNVYLFAASAELATVLRAMVDRAALAGVLGLPATQRVIMAQSVGFPAAVSTGAQ
ncbi:MAG: SagB/ThcOx family dehydrogenase [bacterium]|nr:SagB/ThcOx family dehydrogenase [bacterium]MBK9470963.1 SagB/ThcOx family dehydrogenase [bacterium]